MYCVDMYQPGCVAISGRCGQKDRGDEYTGNVDGWYSLEEQEHGFFMEN